MCISTGVWGFSSDPTPAVFLQKLRVHRRRGFRALVPECAHTERGGEVSTTQKQSHSNSETVSCFIPYVLTVLVFLCCSDSYRLSNEIEAPCEPSPRCLAPTVIITQCPEWVPHSPLYGAAGTCRGPVNSIQLNGFTFGQILLPIYSSFQFWS